MCPFLLDCLEKKNLSVWLSRTLFPANPHIYYTEFTRFFSCDFIALAITHACVILLLLDEEEINNVFVDILYWSNNTMWNSKKKRKNTHAMRPGTEGVVYPFCNCCTCHAVVLCREAKMQVRSGWGNFRQNHVGSVWVKSVNVNKKFLNFLQQQVNHQQVQQNLRYEPAHKQWIIALRTKLRPYLHLHVECPKTHITTNFSTESTTLTGSPAGTGVGLNVLLSVIVSWRSNHTANKEWNHQYSLYKHTEILKNDIELEAKQIPRIS